MALPDKKIKKIQLPGDVQGDKTYEIVPEMLQRDGFGAVLPRMDEDGTLALEGDIWADGETSGTNLIPIPGDFKGNAIDVTEFTGNSFVLNQLAVTTFNSTTVNGITYTNNHDGSWTVNGTATDDSNWAITTNISPKHRYLICGCPTGGSFSTFYLMNDNKPTEAFVDTGSGAVFDWDKSFGWALKIVVKSGVQVSNLKFWPKLIDLTITGLTTAEMANATTAKTALKNRGFDVDMWGHMPNMFDGQLTQINSKAVRGTNFIPATPNTRLNISFQSSVSSTYGFMQFYDASQTNIGEQRYNSGDDVTIPAGCAYVKPQFNHSSSDITPSDISDVWLTYSFYQPGALMDCKPIKWVSRGYNLLTLDRTPGTFTESSNTAIRKFDEGKYYVGLANNNYYAPNQVTLIELTSNRVTLSGNLGYGIAFPVRISGGITYAKAKTSTDSDMYCAWYTAEGRFLKSQQYQEIWTAPASAYWCVVVLRPTGQATYENLCLSLTGTRTGYAPYVATKDGSFTMPALKSAGSVQDESKAGGMKVKKDDLGDETWSYQTPSGGQAHFATTSLASRIKKPENNNYSAPWLLTPKGYAITNISSLIYIDKPDKSMAVDTNGQFVIADSAYDNATSFDTAMTGVPINYALAQATDFTDPISLPQRVPVEAGGSVEVVCASLAIPYAVKYRWQTLVDVPTAVSELSNDAGYATTEYVDQRIDDLPEPMVFKGSLGVGGTITTLPVASSDNKGFTYKVITAGTYQGLVCKVGDTVISDGSAWILIPSGDEPSGTFTSVGLQAGSGSNLTVSGSPITSSGTMTVSVASGYSIPSTSQQTTWSGKQDAITTLTDNDAEHVAFNGYLVVWDDGNEEDDAPRPANSIKPSWDCDLYIYGTGFTVSNEGLGGEQNYRQYSFPDHSGTFAMTNDIGLTLLDLRGYVDA